MHAPKLKELLDSFFSFGDTSAMKEFVGRTRPGLLRVARRIGDAQDAEDSVQAAYHSLLARGASPIDAPCEAWLMTAVVRIAYRSKAVARRQLELAQRLNRPRTAPTPLRRLTREETQRLVRRAVTALPDKYRDVVVLHHLEGLSTAEIAQLLDIARSTVTTRLHRARRLLRHELPPRLAYGVLILPWLLRDMASAGATAASGIGVIMQTKTIATVIVVGLAAGATGYGAATLTEASSTRSSPRADTHERAIHDLEIKLAHAQERARELQAAIDDQAPIPAPRETKKTVSPPKRQKVVNRPKIWEEAQRLKVSSPALSAAVKAERAIAYNADDRIERIRELNRFGEDGFRAALAVVRGSHNAGQPQQRLLDETFAMGLEGLLLATLDSKEVSTSAKQIAIRTLAKADTPLVREYLVQRIEQEKNRSLFFSLTLTLGSLREPRAAAAIGRKLLFDNPVKEADWRLTRPAMLSQLGKMGGEEATRILREFVGDARVTRGAEIIQALNSLAQLNKPLCGELAHQILQEPRGMALSERDAEFVRRFLKYRPQ